MVLRVSLPTQLSCGQFQSKRSCPSKESRRKELHFLPIRRERVQGTSWNGTGQDSSTNGRYSAVTKGNHHRSGGTGSSSRHKLSESRRYFVENFEGNELPQDGRPSCPYALSLSISLSFSLSPHPSLSLSLSIYLSIYFSLSPFFSFLFLSPSKRDLKDSRSWKWFLGCHRPIQPGRGVFDNWYTSEYFLTRPSQTLRVVREQFHFERANLRSPFQPCTCFFIFFIR